MSTMKGYNNGKAKSDMIYHYSKHIGQQVYIRHGQIKGVGGDFHGETF